MGFTRDIPTPLNIPNTVPKRDGNSEFSVSKIHGDLEGNATSSNDGVIEVQGSNGLTLVLSNKVITGSLDQESISSDKNYVFEQLSSSDTWVVSHGLNKFPSVTIVNSSGQVVYGDIVYNSENQVTITFSSAFSGKAFFN